MMSIHTGQRGLRPRLLHWSLSLGLLCAAATALAQNNPDDALGRHLEADVNAAELARVGQWVELPTGSWSVRQFVAVLKRDWNDGSLLVHYRVDHAPVEPDGVGSVTQTTWFYCDQGRKRIIASYGYDLKGKLLFDKQTPQAEAIPLQRLYGGPEQLICSAQYLLLEVPDGYRRFGDAMAQRRATRAARLADRPIPLPSAEKTK